MFLFFLCVFFFLPLSVYSEGDLSFLNSHLLICVWTKKAFHTKSLAARRYCRPLPNWTCVKRLSVRAGKLWIFVRAQSGQTQTGQNRREVRAGAIIIIFLMRFKATRTEKLTPPHLIRCTLDVLTKGPAGRTAAQSHRGAHGIQLDSPVR